MVDGFLQIRIPKIELWGSDTRATITCRYDPIGDGSEESVEAALYARDVELSFRDGNIERIKALHRLFTKNAAVLNTTQVQGVEVVEHWPIYRGNNHYIAFENGNWVFSKDNSRTTLSADQVEELIYLADKLIAYGRKEIKRRRFQ